MSEVDNKRRQFLIASGLTLGAMMLPQMAVASPYRAKSPRELYLCNIHTKEELETRYFDGKIYLDRELKRLNHICRDYRQNEVAPMDRRLFDGISQIQEALGHQGQVRIISGYRSPKTNQMLRGSTKGVAKKSFHMTGQAIDFNLEGVSLSRVRNAALELKLGGVGYYPNSGFVHLDTGPVRRW
ncbi:YcbK family protein [Photobacterium sp. 1_MG-2023]|uniref:YcbK family protein n=1 Tax=Photobacterium sp. 1_MG-2023 TaxID=3062646 RepID=UPI0026E29860|nr:YcbK family protein [Photobacterium sp. 1_MG-2023]MDO6707372.1 YcbK family protein [Photobacterium sp. 1_MG-2023]